jgi:hypothetical protein
MNNENVGDNQGAAGSAGAIGGGASGGTLPPEDEDDPLGWVQKNLPKGDSKKATTRMADNEDHIADLYDALTKGRMNETSRSEGGLDFLRSTMRNGLEIQWRSGSRSVGPTIDVIKQGIIKWKIHMFKPPM